MNYFSQQREQQAFLWTKKVREAKWLSAQGAVQSLPAVVKSFNEMAAASTEPRGSFLASLHPSAFF